MEDQGGADAGAADGPDIAGRYRADSQERRFRLVGAWHLAPAAAVPVENQRTIRICGKAAAAAAYRPPVTGRDRCYGEEPVGTGQLGCGYDRPARAVPVKNQDARIVVVGVADGPDIVG